MNCEKCQAEINDENKCCDGDTCCKACCDCKEEKEVDCCGGGCGCN